ncbi:unnamed protein product [Enterobius vermicularis]|uniref:Uncharacterized protein n=1 Tax=Enterobius vermicularis TaxID=51028 RepID=A0A0N4UZB4_ENTVE|nr:unnamed protein product [Enterobius vermicularis]
MVGHRRDQSDSNVPLRQCSEFHLCSSTGSSHDVNIQIQSTDAVVMQNGMLGSSSVNHSSEQSWGHHQNTIERPVGQNFIFLC